MDKFVTCLCENDLSVLGQAPEKLLNETWLLIIEEYHELKGESIEGMESFSLSRDIKRWNNHLFLLEQCIRFLTLEYNEVIAKAINDLGYSFNPEIKIPVSYLDDLNTIANRSKTKYILLQQLIKKLEDVNAKRGDWKPKREWFEGMLIAIEEMQGVTYNLESMSVLKFVSLEKKYWKQIELQANKNK